MYICKMKKNTLLYLEDEKVALAKKYGLNISKLTEDAIESHLFLIFSREGKFKIDFWEFLVNCSKERSVFFLPSEIKSISIQNFGILKNKNFEFQKLNIITGDSGVEKTSLLRSIAHVFGFESYLSESNFDIELNNSNDKRHIEDEKDFVKSILIDEDAIKKLKLSDFIDFTVYLNELDVQVIMVSKYHEGEEGFNFIEI